MFCLIRNVRTIQKTGKYLPKLINMSQTYATTTSEPELLIEKRSGVCVITLNRPKRYNAINSEMYSNLMSALNSANSDESIKMALMSGKGNYYSSGTDLGHFEKKSDSQSKAGDEGLAEQLRQFVAAFIDFRKPLIGVVNGPAFGIAVTTLALMDCVIASDSATFQTPFSSIGLSPEGCASYTFPNIMGYSRANQMLCFNHKMDAKEALECGFVSRVVPKEQLAAHIEDWVFGPKGLVNTCYPKSMQISKALVRNSDIISKLHEVNRNECKKIMSRWVSEDHKQELKKFADRKLNKK